MTPLALISAKIRARRTPVKHKRTRLSQFIGPGIVRVVRHPVLHGTHPTGHADGRSPPDPPRTSSRHHFTPGSPRHRRSSHAVGSIQPRSESGEGGPTVVRLCMLQRRTSLACPGSRQARLAKGTDSTTTRGVPGGPPPPSGARPCSDPTCPSPRPPSP